MGLWLLTGLWTKRKRLHVQSVRLESSLDVPHLGQPCDSIDCLSLSRQELPVTGSNNEIVAVSDVILSLW